MGIYKILIADQQQMFREALKRLLELEPDFAVVADTADGEQLPKLVADLRPNIVLMDIKLRKRSGLEALRDISAQRPDAGCILLTDSIERSEIVQALVWGARGVVRKESPTSSLCKCIRAVMAGEYWVSHMEVGELVHNLRSLATLVEQSTQVQAHNLSRQQRQIVEAIVAGYSNREIAHDLRLSERTVKYHLTRIFSKFGVSGRMALARYSLKNHVA